MYLAWHAEHRPHQGLEGRTPKEVYDRLPAVERAKLKAKEIPRSELIVRFHEGRRQLPIVEIRTSLRSFCNGGDDVLCLLMPKAL